MRRDHSSSRSSVELYLYTTHRAPGQRDALLGLRRRVDRRFLARKVIRIFGHAVHRRAKRPPSPAHRFQRSRCDQTPERRFHSPRRPAAPHAGSRSAIRWCTAGNPLPSSNDVALPETPQVETGRRQRGVAVQRDLLEVGPVFAKRRDTKPLEFGARCSRPLSTHPRFPARRPWSGIAAEHYRVAANVCRVPPPPSPFESERLCRRDHMRAGQTSSRTNAIARPIQSIAQTRHRSSSYCGRQKIAPASAGAEEKRRTEEISISWRSGSPR